MSEPRFVIKWSPSVDRRYYNLTWQFRKLELFPPFLPTAELVLVDADEEDKIPVAAVAADDDDYTTVCHDPAQAGVTTGKSSVICWDVCSAAKVTCEQLREKFRPKPAPKHEIVKPRDEFDEEERGEEEEEREEEEEEVEEEEEEKVRFPWLDMCKNMIPPIEIEEEIPGTTDPFISHELYMPYSQMPKPRIFESATEKGYIVSTVPKRDRSPIRKVKSGKFDLRAAYKKWHDEHIFSDRGRRMLVESKNRISNSIMELSHEYLDRDVLISSVVLQAICEKVTLTLMHTQIDTDIHTFINIAIIWALSEMELFTPDMLTGEPFNLSEDFLYLDHSGSNIHFDIAGDGGLRKVLMGVYRPPFSRDMFTTLHRRLPWQYMGPAHERGHMKLYPNIRERIQEKSSRMILNNPTEPYISDVTCFHVRDITEKSYVAYTRKSKFFSLSLPSDADAIEDLTRLVSRT